MPGPAKDYKQGPDPLAGHSGKYETVQQITDAMFGLVVLARNKETQELVAIRFFDNRLPKGQWIPLEDKDCLRGIVEQMRLHHPCILDVKEAIACPPYVGMVMESAPDGDVWEYVCARGGLPEEEARWLFQQIVLGMAYCHAKGVSCKDMRLEHTFLVMPPEATADQGGQGGGTARPLLKLRQFDYSALLQDLLQQFPRSRTGDYMAPEAITCLEGNPGPAADAWSAGVMLYALLFARHPFERPEDAATTFAKRVKTTVRRILEVDYEIPASPPISDACRDLITRLLVRDPSQRLPFGAILEHPWVKQDLPSELLEQHRRALQRSPAPVQTEEQLRAVINEVVAANAGDNH